MIIDHELIIQIVKQLEKRQRNIIKHIEQIKEQIICINNITYQTMETQTIKNKLITIKENKKRELEKVDAIINQLKK